MKTITSPHATLDSWIEQMRLLAIERKHSVRIKYDTFQAVALFYVQGQHVESRRLYRI
jgi:hypothetical protein